MVARLAGVDGAAIAVLTTHSAVRELVYATDITAQRLDELQFVTGDGPCLDSFRHRRPYLVSDLSASGDHRWPVFAGEAAALGVAAVFAYPVILADSPLGVLELYRRTAGHLSPIQQQSAAMCAQAAAVTVHRNWDTRASGPEHSSRRDHDSTLEHPEAGGDDPGSFSRAEVHLASGMAAVQLGVSVDDALDRLRGLAFRDGRPIGDVADEIVSRRLRLTPDDEDNTRDRP